GARAGKMTCGACGTTFAPSARPDTSLIDMAFGTAAEPSAINRDAALECNRRGRELVARGDYARAIEQFTEALRFDPHDPILYNNRGYALAARKDYRQAIADFNEALQLDPRSAGACSNR